MTDLEAGMQNGAKDEKIKVLFVDDDVNVLSGLKRSMRASADRCECRFCASGEEGLVLLAEQPADVVVSDMRMPYMDGATFLTHVQSRYPAAVRIILSGYAAPESVLRTVEPAHLYLAKPCTSEALVSAITRPLALRKLLHSEKLRETLAGLSTVPSMPRMFLSLETELTSPNASAQSVATIISQDVAMTAELLKLTNSAYFSVSGRVSTVLQAVRILGLETVQALVLHIGIFRQFSHTGLLGRSLEGINAYSIRLGRLAQEIARSEGATDAQMGLAYCVGLLSSIGSIVLLDSYPHQMSAIASTMADGLSLPQAEDKLVGANHWLVGAYLLGLWGFSEPVVEAIAYALTPTASGGTDNLMLTALHAAKVLGPRFPLMPDGPPAISGWHPDMAYLVNARKDRRFGAWQEIANDLKAEWGL
jgi:HD-like signal output (HDOD) protein